MAEKNIMLVVAYEGTRYCGWQKQPDSPGIQGELEYACTQAFNKKNINITGSGRTDAGVHALGQVANFTVDTTIPVDRIPEVLNNRLPKDIAVLRAQEVKSEFHARHSAHKKTYRYQIYPSRIRSPFLKDFAYQVKYDLDFDRMKREIGHLVGQHDFKGFMSSGSDIKSTVRTIYRADIYKRGDLIVIEVEGNGFLYNMVRIIAGTMVDIGRGRISESLKDIIGSGVRARAGHTAPPQGLFLVGVDYPEDLKNI